MIAKAAKYTHTKDFCRQLTKDKINKNANRTKVIHLKNVKK